MTATKESIAAPAPQTDNGSLLYKLCRTVWRAVARRDWFIPFLAATLLFLNGRRKWVGSMRNGPLTIVVLAACLALFGYIAYEQLGRAFETARAFFADVG